MECLKYNRRNCNAHFCCFKYWVFHEGRYHCYGILIKLRMFDPFFRTFLSLFLSLSLTLSLSFSRLYKNRRGLFAPPEFISIVISFSATDERSSSSSSSSSSLWWILFDQYRWIHLLFPSFNATLNYYSSKFKNSNSEEISVKIVFVYIKFIMYFILYTRISLILLIWRYISNLIVYITFLHFNII